MPAVDCRGMAREPPHHNTSTTTRGAILCVAMLTRIDHVAIGVADFRVGIAAYTRIGFDVDERGVARNDGDHLELVRSGDGLQSIAIASDDLAADSAWGSVDYIKLVEKKNAQPASRHPNGAQRIERVYIAVRDVAADALARRGPGPFQILYRTRSMDAAAKWIADHGLPPPARGVRNTGEQAMLVMPEHACGVVIGFVGPA